MKTIPLVYQTIDGKVFLNKKKAKLHENSLISKKKIKENKETFIKNALPYKGPISGIKVGDIIDIEYYSNMGNGEKKIVTKITTRYNSKTGKPYKVIWFGNRGFDSNGEIETFASGSGILFEYMNI